MGPTGFTLLPVTPILMPIGYFREIIPEEEEVATLSSGTEGVRKAIYEL